jgi:hypothetical protein
MTSKKEIQFMAELREKQIPSPVNPSPTKIQGYSLKVI